MWLFEMKNLRWVIFILVVIAVLLLSVYGAGTTVKMESFSIKGRPDGGYTLSIELNKRYWKLITSEGVLPSIRQTYTIDLIGEGKDWSYRNQSGYYYSLDEIRSIQNQWDFGYAWLSADRKYLYLNLFWVESPDNLAPADVNGKYDI